MIVDSIDLSKLYLQQAKLDERIHLQHHTSYANTQSDRILAFFVELSELANETRCFKYWSEKPASPHAVILEEYVDGVHFLLSLGIALSVDIHTLFEISSQESLTLTEQFLVIYNNAIHYMQNPTLDTYGLLMSNYLILGRMLSFSIREIETAYYEKNAVNFARQDAHY